MTLESRIKQFIQEAKEVNWEDLVKEDMSLPAIAMPYCQVTLGLVIQSLENILQLNQENIETESDEMAKYYETGRDKL